LSSLLSLSSASPANTLSLPCQAPALQTLTPLVKRQPCKLYLSPCKAPALQTLSLSLSSDSPANALSPLSSANHANSLSLSLLSLSLSPLSSALLVQRQPCIRQSSLSPRSPSLTAVAHGPGLRRPPISRHRQRTPASARPPARARRALTSGTCARNRGRRAASARPSGGGCWARGMGRIGKWSGAKQERAAEGSKASRGTPPCVGRRRRLDLRIRRARAAVGGWVWVIRCGDVPEVSLGPIRAQANAGGGVL
jgi:hypothetical protein